MRDGVVLGVMGKFYNQKQHKSLRGNLRQTMPKGEVILWKYLRGSQNGYKFRRQYGVGPYVIDLYCTKLRLGIEVDGVTHADKGVEDRSRDKFIGEQGITIMRFTTDHVIKDLEHVLDTINQVCYCLDNGLEVDRGLRYLLD